MKSESVEAERGVVGALVYLGVRVLKEFLLEEDWLHARRETLKLDRLGRL